MLIDWFTVIAQAINFLVLVWLLKRFLYKPILDAIDARENQIAKTLADAAESKTAAQEQRDEFARKNSQFNADRDSLVHEMKEEINVKRQALLDDAHQSADAISAKRLEAMQRAEKTIANEITRQTQDQVFAISRKTLRDLADAGLEQQIAKTFMRQLQEMNGSAKDELSEALTRASEPARVRSAFELPQEQQTTIRHAIVEIAAADVPVRFEVAPDAIGGIELVSSGRKIAWSIDEYLTSLHKSIGDLMNREAKTAEAATAAGESELESEPVS